MAGYDREAGMAPSVRQLNRWICRRPDDLVDRDSVQLQAILQRCPQLRAATDLVRSFADMLTCLRGQRLDAWSACQSDGAKTHAVLLVDAGGTDGESCLDACCLRPE
nr:hypothetical protein GCM10020063_107310 [Dactylosporangium thailandense]